MIELGLSEWAFHDSLLVVVFSLFGGTVSGYAPLLYAENKRVSWVILGSTGSVMQSFALLLMAFHFNSGLFLISAVFPLVFVWSMLMKSDWVSRFV